MAGAAQIFFDGVDHVLLSGAELFASVAEPPSDGQDAPPRCIFFGEARVLLASAARRKIMLVEYRSNC